MKEFLKYVLATIVGILIMSFVSMVLFFIILGAIVSSADSTVTISSKSILQLNLNEAIAERSSNNPFESFDITSLRPSKKLGLNDIVHNIRKAGEDNNIKGIYLNLSLAPSGPGTLEEIRNALLDFKKTGKFIISYADAYTQGTYYLASVSDSILMNPAGAIPFVGLRAEVMFYKGILDKLGFEPEVIRHGKFKSAVEPFIDTKMSPENREQLSVYANSIWQVMLSDIAEQRHMPADSLNIIADKLLSRTGKDVLNYRMVDALCYKDQVIDILKAKSGLSSNQNLRLVPLSKYDKVPAYGKSTYSRNKIAVIYAMGDIIMGEGQEGNIGSDRISAAIRKAREDSTVKAIVLRVNSGGGSALASEVIWREMHLAREVKPVVASLGDMAASGGYYIVCDADTIVAQPATLTGSIGVFGMLLNARKFMNDKIGITTDVVKTNRYADFASVYRPLSAEEKDAILAGIEDIYSSFITHVAEGRRMTTARVDSIGQGRIWSGVSAMKLGLVDVFGGLDDAIKIAAGMAKLDHYSVTSLPQLEPPMEQIMRQLYGEVKMSIIPAGWKQGIEIYNTLQYYMQYSGIQARLPMDIDLH